MTDGRRGAQDDRSELCRMIAPAEIGEREVLRQIEATESERAAVARRLGLASLDSLRASLRLARSRCGGLIRLSADFEAKVVQTCVVSLEPVVGRLSESFSVTYALEQRGEPAAEVDLDVQDEDPPEPVGAQGIDLGEAVVQQLATALDPYPRKPGVTFDRSWPTASKDSHLSGNPFEKLQALKRDA